MRIYKYRLYPTPEQEIKLNNNLSLCCDLWNLALEHYDRNYRDSKIPIPALPGTTAFFEALKKSAVSYRLQTVQDLIPHLKQYEALTLLKRLDGIHSQPYQETLQRLDKAYKEYFAGTRKRPRYKKLHSYQSITFTQYGTACQIKEQINGKKVLSVSKIGEIELLMHRNIPENTKVKQIIIKKNSSGRWFVSFMVDGNFVQELPEPKFDITAYDRGVVHLTADNHGNFIDPPKALNRHIKKLQKLNQSISRKIEVQKREKVALGKRKTKQLKKSRTKNKYAHLIKNDILSEQKNKMPSTFKVGYTPSSRFLKTKKTLARTYERIADIRDDFAHKTSKGMIKQSKVILLEDLKVANMVKNPKLAKVILDASWSSLSQKVLYKAESAGREVVFMPPHYSSQECSQCHHISSENRLTQSIFKCIKCGNTNNADVNAAKTLVYRYKQQLARGPRESLNGHGGKVNTAAMSQTELMKCQEAPAIV